MSAKNWLPILYITALGSMIPSEGSKATDPGEYCFMGAAVESIVLDGCR
eukprot:CAMPEP_0169319246 /NCGR_PEP_ID=MMETSP1017-20121227/7732_1 /TAXON_ID=342587 /ORGANISM="Karlodinium micrum, Strain CCMP2283" /LENGTH=48 /DNA_ID= /DNA_START= /DNA_END= /DNA_ORIENTATION=